MVDTDRIIGVTEGRINKIHPLTTIAPYCFLISLPIEILLKSKSESSAADCHNVL